MIAGVGGLILGHILWLISITLARRSPSGSTWVLVISALVILGAAAAGYVALQKYRRKELVGAAFLGALPVLPLILTVIVLGVTYL